MHPSVRGLVALLGTTVLVVACSSSTETASQSSSSEPPTTPSIDARPAAPTPLLAEVLAPPIPVPTTDGKVHLAYELQPHQRGSGRT